jgi:hypothetical protein
VENVHRGLVIKKDPCLGDLAVLAHLEHGILVELERNVAAFIKLATCNTGCEQLLSGLSRWSFLVTFWGVMAFLAAAVACDF